MEKFFASRAREYKIRSLKHRKSAQSLTVIRILLFSMFLAMWIFLISEGLYTFFVIAFILFPLVFGYVVNRHRLVNQKQQFFNHLVTINDEEINRLNNKPQNFFNGSTWMDESHPYSSDLDIYGPKSLYHYLNRCSTPAGEDTLAMWLGKPAEKNEILLRQECVEELSSQVDWRQELQATELEIQRQDSLDNFFEWLNTAHSPIKPWLIYILPLIALASITLWLIGTLNFYIPSAVILLNAIIIGKYSKRTSDLNLITGHGLSSLKKYRHIITLIEHKDFIAKRLKTLQHNFSDKGYRASGALKKLERILEFFDSRSNMFYHILNLIFLIDLHLIYQSLKWQKKNTGYVSKWFESIGEVEALSSFAGFYYANKNICCIPKIEEEDFIYQATHLAHPLIHKNERVANDYEILGKGTVHIITGSNMSGKSTFLRTVTINAVMAYAGAPVCAENLQISIMKVFTGMRTHDDLEAHVSSFYAELKRIRQLLESLETSTSPYLFVMDEILKGTNSHDRNTGAAALIRQLRKLNCMGMISTHDLVLGQMERESGGILNYSFNSDITEDKIIFDYKINKGICSSFNASKLMEQMGIKINQQ